MYVCVCACANMNARTYVCVYMSTFLHSVCVCACVYVNTRACVCGCVYESAGLRVRCIVRARVCVYEIFSTD